VRGAEWPVIECWPIDRVWSHRDRFNKVGQRHYSYNHPEMYARKVVLLQVLKYMPASIEMQQVMDLDRAAEEGRQSIDLMQAATGEWIPPEAEETRETAVSTPDPVPPYQPPAESKPQQRPAPVENTQNAAVWPQQDEDELWYDKSGRVFDPALYAWDDETGMPAVYKRGRSSGHFMRLPEKEEADNQSGGDWNLE
jgi:hypothetical protein